MTIYVRNWECGKIGCGGKVYYDDKQGIIFCIDPVGPEPCGPCNAPSPMPPEAKAKYHKATPKEIEALKGAVIIQFKHDRCFG